MDDPRLQTRKMLVPIVSAGKGRCNSLGGPMSMTRQWLLQCDHQGCRRKTILDVGRSRDDAGMEANDLGWQAAPALTETFCPDHWLPDEEWQARIDKKTASQREAMIRKTAQQLAEAFEKKSSHN